MTPIILLDRLEEFVTEVTKDIKLQVKVRNLNPEEEKERTANVHKMRLPKKEDQVQQILNELMVVGTGLGTGGADAAVFEKEDDQDPGQYAESQPFSIHKESFLSEFSSVKPSYHRFRAGNRAK